MWIALLERKSCKSALNVENPLNVWQLTSPRTGIAKSDSLRLDGGKDGNRRCHCRNNSSPNKRNGSSYKHHNNKQATLERGMIQPYCLQGSRSALAVKKASNDRSPTSTGTRNADLILLKRAVNKHSNLESNKIMSCYNPG
jgi:hypothetical protein